MFKVLLLLGMVAFHLGSSSPTSALVSKPFNPLMPRDNCTTTTGGTNVNVICSQNCNSPCCSGIAAGNIVCANIIADFLNKLDLSVEVIASILANILNSLLKMCQEAGKGDNKGCTATATGGTSNACVVNVGNLEDLLNLCKADILSNLLGGGDDTETDCIVNKAQENGYYASCCTGDYDGYSQCTGNVTCGNSNRDYLSVADLFGTKSQTAKCCTVDCNGG